MNFDTNQALNSMSEPKAFKPEEINPLAELNSSVESTVKYGKGRRTDPVTLERYHKILSVLKERPNEFSKKELCDKHGVTYGNFMQWYKKHTQPKEVQPPKFKPERIEPAFIGQSIIACTIDDLLECITPHIREGIKDAIRNGVKDNKLKIIRS